MNPLQEFRSRVLAAYEADLPPREKMAALMRIQLAIVRYQDRLRQIAREEEKASFGKAIAYLEALSKETLRLAQISSGVQ